MTSRPSGLKPLGLKPPNKVARPTTLATSKPMTPGSNGSPAGQIGSVSGTATPLSAASSMSALNDNKSEIGDVLTDNTDDFIIGDRVWVNGTKPGYIQYIGETQFAPGDWAGIVLDDPVGKNDGSVAGVRYFQCEPKRGVFARLHRLTRLPTPVNGTMTTTLQGPGKTTVTTTRVSSASPTGSVKSATPRAVTTSTVTTTVDHGLKVGDRVVVNATSGIKTGYLRYVGTTDFATGQWAGIELDEPVGKNDGSVAGKRYFDCPMKYGLFAPIHKVSRASGHTRTTTTTTTRVTKVTSSPMSRTGRSGSHESLNSSLSSASSTARARKSTKPVAATLTATHNALQDALKEKEEHIEQLLKERDLERAEVAKAASQVDEAEQKLSGLQFDHQRYVDEMEHRALEFRQLLDNNEKERKELLSQMEDLQRKLEDVQFRLEEEEIVKSDLEVQAESLKSRVSELEEVLESEKLKGSLQSEKDEGIQEVLNKYKQESMHLKEKLEAAEAKINSLETQKAEEKGEIFALQDELLKKNESILQLEASLESHKKDMSTLSNKFFEVESNLNQSKEIEQKQKEEIQSLSERLARAESESSNIAFELQEMKINSSDLQRKLSAAEEHTEQLLKSKQKLEEDVAELRNSSGSNSEQFSKMNEELRQKERHLEELEGKVRAFSQEAEKYKEMLSQAKEQQEKEMNSTKTRHTEDIENMKRQMSDLSTELEKSKQHCISLNGTITSLENSLSEKDTIIVQLKKENQSCQAQLTKHNTQLQEMQQQLEKVVNTTSHAQGTLEAQIQESHSQKKKLEKELEEVKKKMHLIQDEKCQTEKQRDQLLHDQQMYLSTMSDRDRQISLLKAEVERLELEFSSHRENLVKQLQENKFDTKAAQDLHEQLQNNGQFIQDLQEKLEATQQKNDDFHNQVEQLKKELKAKEELASISASLEVQLDELRKRESSSVQHHNSEKEALRKQLESSENALNEKAKEITTLHREIGNLKSSLENQNTSNQLRSLEQEKKQLENKVVELQVAVARSQANANTSDPEFKKIKDEKETLEAQIDFLNTVIVDMQKKNDELTTRIQVLETGFSVEDMDLNLNGIKTTVPPRLFCDICDMFDLHDTDDCPKQAASEDELSQHSRHGGKRVEPRPYCENCETFGHTKEECDDNETF